MKTSNLMQKPADSDRHALLHQGASSSLKNELRGRADGPTGIFQACKRLKNGARLGFTSSRSELKNARDGVFQQTARRTRFALALVGALLLLCQTATAQIIDPPPIDVDVVAIVPQTGESGPGARFELQLSRASDGPVFVVTALGGSATYDSDYKTGIGVEDVVIIPPGTTTSTIDISPIDDTIIEPDEDVVLTITNADGANVGARARAQIIITDDDDRPSVSPSALNLIAGQSAQLSVIGGSAPYTWSSDNDVVATVNGSGVVSAGAAGSAVITVTDSRGFSARAAVTVIEPLAVTPAGAELLVGETQRFNASGGNAPYTWSTSDPSIASIDAAGLLTARAPGRVTVTLRDSQANQVTTGAIDIAAPVAITPRAGTLSVGATLAFAASGGFAPYRWSTSDNAVASINNQGLLTARAPGSVRVTVTDRLGHQATTDFVEIVRDLAVTPASASIVVDKTVSLTASGGLPPYTWASSDPAIASVNGSGLVSAKKAGAATITVTDSLGNRATAAISVLAALSVSPASAELLVGQTQEFRASGGATPYTWSSSNTSLATINAAGLLTARAAGSVTVTLRDSQNNQISTDAIDIAAPLAVTPSGGTLSVGATLSFSVSGGFAPYRWSSSDNAVASVNNQGLLTAKAPGTVRVSVTDRLDHQVSTNLIDVVRGLALTPNTGTLLVGDRLAFAASGGVAPYRWTSSDASIARIDDRGVLTGLKGGNVTVSVTDSIATQLVSGPIQVILPAVSIEASDANAAEAGPDPGQFTVRVSPAAPAAGLVVRYRVEFQNSGGSTAADFSALSGLLNVAAGATAATIALEPIADAQTEPAEPVTLVLERSAGYGIGEADQATVTIAADAVTPDPGPGPGPSPDPIPISARVYASDANAIESGSTGAFTIELDRASERDLTINYSASRVDVLTQPGGATLAAGDGFAPLPGNIVIAAGAITATVLIAPVDNDVADGPRTVALRLLSGEGYQAAAGGSEAFLTIADDEGLVADAPADASALTIQRIVGTATQTARTNTDVEMGVRVLDADGTALPGIALSWTLNQSATAAGASFAATTATTDADGEGTATLRTAALAAVHIVTVRASTTDSNGAPISVSESFTINAGLIHIVDADTPEGAMALALDGICPQLNEGSAALGSDSAALLDRCTEFYSALGDGADDAIVAALRSVAPEETAARGTVGVRNATRQLRNVAERLRALRRGAKGLSLSGLAFDINDETLSGMAFEPLLRGASGSGAGDERPAWLNERTGVFITGNLDFGEKERTAQEAGFDAEGQTLTAGIDYRLSSQTLVGVALGYVTSALTLDDNGGDLDSDGYNLSAYGSYYRNQWFVDGIVHLGNNRYDLQRRIDYNLAGSAVQRIANSDSDSRQWGLSVAAGKDIVSDRGINSTLYARLEHVRADVDAMTETGAAEFNLQLDDQQAESTLLSLGGAVSRAFSMRWGVLIPGASLSWEFETADAYRIQGRFVADPAATGFAFDTDAPDSSYLRAGLGISAEFGDGLSAFVQYESVLQRDHYDEESINVGLRYALRF